MLGRQGKNASRIDRAARRVEKTRYQEKMALGSLNETLYQHETPLRSFNETPYQHETALRLLNQTLYQHETALRSFNETLYQHETALRSFNETLYQHETALRSFNETLYEENMALRSFNETLYQHETALRSFNETLYEENMALRSFNETLYQHETALRSFNETLYQHETALRSLNEAIYQGKMALRLLNETLYEHETTLCQSNKTLLHRDRSRPRHSPSSPRDDCVRRWSLASKRNSGPRPAPARTAAQRSSRSRRRRFQGGYELLRSVRVSGRPPVSNAELRVIRAEQAKRIRPEDRDDHGRYGLKVIVDVEGRRETRPVYLRLAVGDFDDLAHYPEARVSLGHEGNCIAETRAANGRRGDNDAQRLVIHVESGRHGLDGRDRAEHENAARAGGDGCGDLRLENRGSWTGGQCPPAGPRGRKKPWA